MIYTVEKRCRWSPNKKVKVKKGNPEEGGGEVVVGVVGVGEAGVGGGVGGSLKLTIYTKTKREEF